MPTRCRQSAPAGNPMSCLSHPYAPAFADSDFLQPLPQCRLQNLAVMVLGQIGNEKILLRPLEAGDVSEAKRIESPVVDSFPVARHHERHHFFSPLRM